MNRIVLCGRLAGPPKIAYTPCGVPVATLRLLVSRTRKREQREQKDPVKEEVVDEIDCVAFREIAIELHAWGGRDLRVNLEGRLHQDEYQDESGRKVRGPRVYVDHAYAADPTLEPAAETVESASPAPTGLRRLLCLNPLPKAA